MPVRLNSNVTMSTFTLLFVVVCFVIMFSFTVHNTDFAWRQYRASLSIDDWRREVCNVTWLKPSECDDRGEQLLLVKVCVLPNNESDCNAGYRRETEHPFDRTCIKKDDLDAFVKENNISVGQKIPCWVGPFYTFVRLDEGGYEDRLRGLLKMRGIYTTTVSVLLGLVVIYFLLKTYQTLKRPPPRRNSVYTHSLSSPAVTATLRPNGRPSSAPLTNWEANAFLCACKLEQPITEETCPICLEKFGDGQRPTIRFSCNHDYHFECAHQWLQKGGPKCPLCFKDLSADVAQNLDPKPQISPNLVLQTDPHSHSTEHHRPNQGPTSSSSLPHTPNSSPTTAPTRVMWPSIRNRAFPGLLERPFLQRYARPP